MEFKAKDFDGLSYKAYGIPDSDLFAIYPILETYFKSYDVPKGMSKAKIVKYIIFLYDKNTPLLSLDSLVKRKVQAISLAQFPKDKNNKYLNDYIAFIDSPTFGRMTIQYCRIQKNYEFSQLVQYDDLFYSEMDKAKLEEDATKRTSILKNIETLGDRIKVLTEQILNEDTSLDIRKCLYDEIENESLALRPEDIAKKMSQGKPALLNFVVCE